MSIISKICVLFLAWTVFGIGACICVTCKYFIRAAKLDNYKKGGSNQKKFERYSGNNLDACLDDAHVDMTNFMALVFAGMIWPISVPFYDNAFGKAYDQMKKEYEHSKESTKESG